MKLTLTTTIIGKKPRTSATVAAAGAPHRTNIDTKEVMLVQHDLVKPMILAARRCPARLLPAKKARSPIPLSRGSLAK